MWDEKKFFEDFVKESEKIKPEEEFIQKMKHLEERKVKRFSVTHYAAVAAALVCVIGGAVLWKNSRVDLGNSKYSIEESVEIQAGKSEWNIQSGKISNGQNETYSEVLSFIERDDTRILDENDRELSQTEKTELIEQLKDAEPIEEEIDGTYKQYSCPGEKTFSLKVYEGQEDGSISVLVEKETE